MLLTSKQAAERLGVSQSAVGLMVKAGRLAAVRDGDATAKRRTIAIDPEVLRAFKATYRKRGGKRGRVRLGKQGGGNAPADWLTTRQAGERAGTDFSYVGRLIRLGRLVARLDARGRYRVDPASVDAYLAAPDRLRRPVRAKRAVKVAEMVRHSAAVTPGGTLTRIEARLGAMEQQVAEALDRLGDLLSLLR